MTRHEGRRLKTGIGEVENNIIIALEGNESFEEILLDATSIPPRVDTDITLLHVLPVGQG